MELHACGFNAWNQLYFDTREVLEAEPDDYREFKCVLNTEEDILFVRAGLSWTLGEALINSNFALEGSVWYWASFSIDWGF